MEIELCIVICVSSICVACMFCFREYMDYLNQKVKADMIKNGYNPDEKEKAMNTTSPFVWTTTTKYKD